jgi:hypothetical protein
MHKKGAIFMIAMAATGGNLMPDSGFPVASSPLLPFDRNVQGAEKPLSEPLENMS